MPDIKEKIKVRDARIAGFSERLSAAIKIAGGPPNMAIKTGLSESVLRKWRAGGSDPTLSNLYRIASASGVSVQWLSTGEGPMQPGQEPETTQEGFNKEFALVPLYNIEASAGPGATAEDEHPVSQVAFRRDWLNQCNIPAKPLVSITARGDSMEPTLSDGNLLLVDTSQKQVIDDGIYVIRADNHLLAKRLQRLLDGTIYIKSDNPAYTQQTIPPQRANEIDVVGRVVWTGRKV